MLVQNPMPSESLFSDMRDYNLGPQGYLELIREAKAQLKNTSDC